MSTLSTLTAPAAPATRPALKVTGPRVLRAEWAKLWSLRSTWITLSVGVLLLVLVGTIASASYSPGQVVAHGPAADAKDAVGFALGGMGFTQLALGVLGVLITAGEYSTGMIRSTLAAVPRRLPVLWSKASIYAVVALVLGTAGAFAAFLIGSGYLHGTPIALTLSSSGVLRCLFGAGAYLALVGVMGVALGALLRSVAGGISVLVVSLMLLPALAGLLPSGLKDDISPYLPGNAGDSIFALTHAAHTLTPGAGLAVFAGWTALALAGAAWRLRRSDV
ncbi:ABC-2 type transport system permease protein [Kitasatospora sp. MAP12-15]|uniref:ABC transporter permease n=1 Tax=unclassified Kitasatospora TaxID=2633591 RepID=UPI002473768D|nr:ABC transporter permease [Kitasatospora sp. MAP12-44]MDH6108687.1 ABC-2 type transport system permease protein [Kitasatospora sp. MAP12-44]